MPANTRQTVVEQDSMGDKDSKGDYIKSAVEAFPYSLLKKDTVTGEDTPNQISHYSSAKMASEKRKQRNDRFNMVIDELQEIEQRANCNNGKLDVHDVEEATELVDDAVSVIIDYTNMVLKHIDTLKQLVHA